MLDIFKIIAEKNRFPSSKVHIAPGITKEKNDNELKVQDGKVFPILLVRPNKSGILLEEREAFVWNLIEENLTIEKINIKYYFKYKKLGTEYIRDLIKTWQEQGLVLDDKNLYTSIKWSSQFLSAVKYNTSILSKIYRLLSWRIEFSNVDSFFSAIYRFFNPLCNKYIIAFLIFLAFVGFALTVIARNNNLDILTNTDTKYLNIGILLLLNFLHIFIHESGHAIASKHFGLQIKRAGFRFFLGYPVFWVDTTNAWTLKKNNRIIISMAGMVASFIATGIICLFFILIIPNTNYLILNQLVFINLMSIGVNLIPLVEFDGYYILIDLIDMPNLKTKSLKIVEKLFTSQTIVNKQHLVFLFMFGVLSIISTAIFLTMSIWAWIKGLSNLF